MLNRYVFLEIVLLMKISRLLHEKVRITKNEATWPLAKVLNWAYSDKKELGHGRGKGIEICDGGNDQAITKPNGRVEGNTELPNLC